MTWHRSQRAAAQRVVAVTRGAATAGQAHCGIGDANLGISEAKIWRRRKVATSRLRDVATHDWIAIEYVIGLHLIALNCNSGHEIISHFPN